MKIARQYTTIPSRLHIIIACRNAAEDLDWLQQSLRHRQDVKFILPEVSGSSDILIKMKEKAKWMTWCSRAASVIALVDNLFIDCADCVRALTVSAGNSEARIIAVIYDEERVLRGRFPAKCHLLLAGLQCVFPDSRSSTMQKNLSLAQRDSILQSLQQHVEK